MGRRELRKLFVIMTRRFSSLKVFDSMCLYCSMQQVPDEFERVLVGIQSYISIRRHFDDIAFSVFETDEGHSPNKKVLLILNE